MAGLALTTIGAIFGFGIGTETVAPTTFTEIEECTAVTAVETDAENIDVTPLKAKRHQYARGYENVSETVDTTFNYSDVFVAQWRDLLEKYEALTSTQRMWFCVYIEDAAEMDCYIVTPGSIPAKAYEVGNALQVTIKNTLVKFPDPIKHIKPAENTIQTLNLE